MEFELSFTPVNHDRSLYSSGQLGSFIDVYTEGRFPDLTEVDVVLFSVPEFRGTSIKGSVDNFQRIREEYFKLFSGYERLRVVDLGNLLIGENKSDTFYLLSEVLQECERRNLFALIIGGGQDATFAQYKASANAGKTINLVSVDSRFDLGVNSDSLNANSYLSKIIEDQPNYLFNFSNIGYQSFLVPNTSVQLIENLYFDAIRLGVVRSDIEEVEPILRNADLLSVDVSSVRLSDAPGNKQGSPNGFSGSEICQILRYAGLGGRLTSLGIYEFDVMTDLNNQTAKLISQMIWYFLEGYFHRMKRVVPNEDDFVKYHVSMRDSEFDGVFYKNKQLDKWWMEIPVLDLQEDRFKNHCFIPCSYNDYCLASQGDLPDRWWRAFQKLN